MIGDIFRVLGRALSAVFGNLGIVIPVILVPSVAMGILDHVLFNALNIDTTGQDANIQIFKVGMAWQASALGMEILYGPIFAATAVYVGRGTGKPGLYAALNFALNRYSRVFKWHAAAFILINVGMIVILPGILYTLRYAFVDSVCCIEDEKWPLARSTKLTRGRRKRIFLIFLPYFIYIQVAMLAYLQVVADWYLLAGIHMLTYFVVYIFAVAMYVMYEERTTKRKKKTEGEVAAPVAAPERA